MLSDVLGVNIFIYDIPPQASQEGVTKKKGHVIAIFLHK